LTLDNTTISDLTPVAGLTSLVELNLDLTQVSDLAPLAQMMRMRGLSYAQTPVSRTSPFDRLVHLDQPSLTIETINEVRRQQGLPEYFPGPLLDLSDAAVKKFIKTAKARGFVTLDALNAVLPSEEVSSEQIEDTISMLSDMGITVVESDEADE